MVHTDRRVSLVYDRMRDFSKKYGVESDALLIGKRYKKSSNIEISDAVFLPEFYDNSWIISRNKDYFSEDDMKKIQDALQNRINLRKFYDSITHFKLAISEIRKNINFHGDATNRASAFYLPGCIFVNDLERKRVASVEDAIGHVHVHPWVHEKNGKDLFSFTKFSKRTAEPSYEDRAVAKRNKSIGLDYHMVIGMDPKSDKSVLY